MGRLFIYLAALGALSANAADFLVKLSNTSVESQEQFMQKHGGKLQLVSEQGNLFRWVTPRKNVSYLWADQNVEFVQKNYRISLLPNPSLINAKEALKDRVLDLMDGPAYPDNPDFKTAPSVTAGADPLLSQSWGLTKVSATTGWANTHAGQGVVVAVTDTGVDYNHEDLIQNIWHNSKEIAGDGVDNDGNGYVDDIVGWDFVSNDNKPYDLSMSLMDILMSGGNPGHGTHVAGVVGSALKNKIGTAGMAPKVSIMALRFIGEQGQGNTEGAIKSIDYAVKNGAKVINASWGGEAGSEDDKALREAFDRAEKAGVLIAVAAGNGRANQATQKYEGFDNDIDPHPFVPASFTNSNIVTVAAIDVEDNKAEFSNFGHKTCALGAPGVKILSTVPGNRYQDTIVDMGQIKVTWDGTSMASPHVAGALAALWSKDPNAKAETIRHALLDLTVKIPSMNGKVSTEGRLDLSGVTR